MGSRIVEAAMKKSSFGRGMLRESEEGVKNE
jgi:hypothetical protein